MGFHVTRLTGRKKSGKESSSSSFWDEEFKPQMTKAENGQWSFLSGSSERKEMTSPAKSSKKNVKWKKWDKMDKYPFAENRETEHTFYLTSFKGNYLASSVRFVGKKKAKRMELLCPIRTAQWNVWAPRHSNNSDPMQLPFQWHCYL